MTKYEVELTQEELYVFEIEAENEDEAVAYAEAMLDEEHYYAHNFNDIEATHLPQYEEW